MKVRHTVLFAAADSETPTPSASGSGGDAAPGATLTLGGQLKAMLKDKTTLQAEVERGKTDLKAAQDKITDLEGKLSAAEAERDQLRADMSEIKTTLEGAQAEVKNLAAKEQDLDKRASDQAKAIVRGAGIDAEKLPAAVATLPGDEIEALERKLAATTDPEEAGKLVMQIKKAKESLG